MRPSSIAASPTPPRIPLVSLGISVGYAEGMVPPHGLIYVVVPSIGTNLLNTFCLPIVFPRLFSKSKLILSYGLSYGVPKGGKMTTQILI